ncbi:MAG: exosortase system-associated protein, TIGR04073 family [Candidatus Omnitrophota bacterium]|jgi:putative exosortase-associated protein (TIGR04073 family)
MKKIICFFIILSQMFLFSYAQDEAESAATQPQLEATPVAVGEPVEVLVEEEVLVPVVQKEEVKKKAVNKKQAIEEMPQEPCQAPQEVQGTVVLRERVSDQNPLRKVSRGAVNATLGWVEIPRQMMKVNKAKGDVAGVFWGPLKGFAFFVGRTAVGIYEVTTFLLPPYKPVVSPEFIFSEDDED